jgi:CRP/FNR family cyclic AMP-dependent transcriptional regulator
MASKLSHFMHLHSRLLLRRFARHGNFSIGLKSTWLCIRGDLCLCSSRKGAPLILPGRPEFDTAAYLAHAGLGRRIVQLEPKQALFSQGDPADSIFYLQNGRAKITVVSQTGKDATITILSACDFVGEESLTATHRLRLATTTAITACSALKINREEMIRVLHEEHEFSDLFLKFLLARSMRNQANLIDQLFNSSEKRLARLLLQMAEICKTGEPEQYIPKISQETLAEMIGTTRSRVSFFMNRFRKLGLIDYNGRIHVHKSLINVVLYDQFPGGMTEEASVLESHRKLEKYPD